MQASIIIPAYNAETLIDAAITSALNQTLCDCEVIVIDDGSTDGTLEVAKAFEQQGVRVEHQTNAGAATARNHGLSLAGGEYVQFLDADDLLAPNKIALQIEALQANPPYSLAFGRWGRFHHDPSHAAWNNEAVYRSRSGIEFLQLHYETGSMLQPGAWLAARSLLKAVGPWDESLSLNDDGEYFARVMLQASNLVAVPEARCFYRSGRDNSLSRRQDANALQSLFRSVELTTGHLQAADRSPRTHAACVQAWRRVALELYPDQPSLARTARARASQLGGSDIPLGAPDWVETTARIVGWTMARRLQRLRNRLA